MKEYVELTEADLAMMRRAMTAGVADTDFRGFYDEDDEDDKETP